MTDAALARALLAWYRRRSRDLPWRRTRDPYAIWLSEVMLQQTTVEAVTPRYHRFLERFPTVGTLAAARERDVLAEWSGLGYYARAKNLHRSAREVVRAGGFPRTVEGLRALPGVGPYTAAAVASIAFGVPEPVVDGNVVRVLCRLHGLRLDPRAPATIARVRALARPFVSSRAAGDRNQALMELGALVCTPRSPACEACPFRTRCRARATTAPETFPRAPTRKIPTKLHLVAGVTRRRGRLLVVEDEHLVTGHLIVPMFPVGSAERASTVLRTEWRRLTGRTAGPLTFAGLLHHSVLTRRYRVEVFAFEEKPPPGGREPPRVNDTGRPSVRTGRRIRLVRDRELSHLAHGALLQKVLGLLAPAARGR